VAPEKHLRIGIDLDNTLACYDRVFVALARERGLLAPGGTPPSRIELRQRLRREGREDLWTEMQGVAYGPRMAEVEPFAGVVDFVARCADLGAQVFIISHRTRYPYRGEPHDLHAAARAWLERQGFIGHNDSAIAAADVFLELDRRRKLQRIATLRCTSFVDDLPEIFEDEDFPRSARPILFDPDGGWKGRVAIARATSWNEIAALILGDTPGDAAGEGADMMSGPHVASTCASKAGAMRKRR
jgi:hypothetical protein